MKTLINICLLFFPLLINAQKNDYIWVYGRGWGGGCLAPSINTDFDFSTIPPNIYAHCRHVPIDFTNAAISDDLGHLVAYTNGLRIFNAQDQIIANGDSINYGTTPDMHTFWSSWLTIGDPVNQGALFIPYPDHKDQYILFTMRARERAGPTYAEIGDKLNYSIIDMAMNGGAGQVLQREVDAVLDSISMATLTACRHANGRDWWIVVGRNSSDFYYALLVDPWGVHSPTVQHLGHRFSWQDEFGQTVFSPDGTKMARYTSNDGLYIYDFDRCTGLLGNAVYINMAGSFSYTGVGFSPSSQYLYSSSADSVCQYDLYALPIASSKVVALKRDTGFIFNHSPCGLFFQHLGSDGKIYVNPADGQYLSTIDRPDLPGLHSTARNHSLRIPGYTSSNLPNFPNYRLGPVDGTVCDSLGYNQALAQHTHQLDFGSVLLGQGTTRTFWLSNPGEGALHITESYIDSASHYALLSPALPYTVPPHDSVLVTVGFTPQLADTIEALLTLRHNGIFGLSTVGLSGIGYSTVGVSQVGGAFGGRWSVVPNPAATQITIAHTLPAQAGDVYKVVNSLGQTVLTVYPEVGQLRLTINVSAWPSGMYWVRDGEGFTESFVKL